MQMGMDPSWKLDVLDVSDPNPLPQLLFPAQCAGKGTGSSWMLPVCQWCPMTLIPSHGEIQLRLPWRNPSTCCPAPQSCNLSSSGLLNVVNISRAAGAGCGELLAAWELILESRGWASRNWGASPGYLAVTGLGKQELGCQSRLSDLGDKVSAQRETPGVSWARALLAWGGGCGCPSAAPTHSPILAAGRAGLLSPHAKLVFLPVPALSPLSALRGTGSL